MARFPADTKLQNFFTEQYEKEDRARLQFFFDTKRGTSGTYGQLERQNSTLRGLPSINPMEFSRNKLKEERQRLAEIVAQARTHSSTEEMRAPEPKTKDKLYVGFTKEGKGRYSYLKDRLDKSPETKYTFPICSSMVYGWKITGDPRFGKPRYARTREIQDTFYSRNGVPDLGGALPGLGRSYTTL